MTMEENQQTCDGRMKRKLVEMESEEEREDGVSNEKGNELKKRRICGEKSTVVIEFKERCMEWSSQVRLIVQQGFRECCGLDRYWTQGFFVDRFLGDLVFHFADWIEYAKGNRVIQVDSAPSAIAMNDDGRYMFVGCQGGSIEVWSLVTDSKIEQQWKAEEGSVLCLDFHKSGILISGGTQKIVQVWDAYTQKLLQCFKGHESDVVCVHSNHSGDQIVSGSKDSTVRVWSLISGECIYVLRSHDSWLKSVYFTQSVILSVSLNNPTIEVYDPSNDETKRCIEKRNGFKNIGFKVNCDESWMVWMDIYNCYVFSMPVNMQQQYSFNHSVTAACFHPCKPDIFALASLRDGLISIYNLRRRIIIGRFKHEILVPMENICFSPNGSRLIAACSDKSIHIWDVYHVLK